MKKKVLIGYANYGASHRSAAQYIKNYFEDKDKYEILMINVTSYVSSNKSIRSKILSKASKISFFHNLFYGLSNNKPISNGNEKLCIKSFDSPTLRKVITDYNPDIVIGTHFFVGYLGTFYKELGIITSPIMLVLSDAHFHKNWIVNHENIDYFIVQNEIVKNELVENKVNSKKIYPYGTPINYDSLSRIDDKDFVLKRYSLSGDKPIYLMFAGGSSGYDYVFDYFKAIVKRNYPIDIIFVAGKNKELKVKCENFLLKYDIKNVLVLGFTKDVFNLLNISDVVITKPGSSTLNECMLMRKPCILIPGIGGHENFNAKIMTKKHYAVKVRNANGLARKIKQCLNYPFIVNSMRNRLEKTEINDSVSKIYELVDNILSKK